MVPIPPPPAPPSTPVRPAPAQFAGDAAEIDPDSFLRPGQLTSGWRWLFVLGWAAICAGLFALADAVDTVGKPTWWMHPQSRAPLVFLLPLAAVVAGLANWRRSFWIGLVASIELGFSALADISRSPGAAVVQGALALAGLLITVASIAGRMRKPEPSTIVPDAASGAPLAPPDPTPPASSPSSSSTS
jgi:hypothetical protein